MVVVENLITASFYAGDAAGATTRTGLLHGHLPHPCLDAGDGGGLTSTRRECRHPVGGAGPFEPPSPLSLL